MNFLAQKKDARIPKYFILFFLILAFVNIIFLFLAFSTHRGVVTKNAYQKGLNYNQTLIAFDKQKNQGWIGNLYLNQSLLEYNLKDKFGAYIKKAVVNAHFYHVTQSGYDFKTILKNHNDGSYDSLIKFPSKGQWIIRIAAKFNNHHHQQSLKVNIK